MKKLIEVIIIICASASVSWSFSVSKDPFTPLIKTQAIPSSQPANAALMTSSDFTLKMVVWGSLKGALLEDNSNGMVYVAMEGTKIGPVQVLKIIPNKVILKTPNGIKELSLKDQNNTIPMSKKSKSQNKNIQDTSNKTLTNEVK